MSGVIDVSQRVPDKLTFAQRIYLPEILRGMKVTLGHLLRNLANMKRMPTILYPEQKRNYSKRFRGKHILKAREDGTLKCVACFMCQQACPAECITIVAGEAPWPDRDKYPVKFEIDMLKCIYCGMCEEACPCDAIELTQTFTQVSTTRAEKIYDKERLLGN